MIAPLAGAGAGLAQAPSFPPTLAQDKGGAPAQSTFVDNSGTIWSLLERNESAWPATLPRGAREHGQGRAAGGAMLIYLAQRAAGPHRARHAGHSLPDANTYLFCVAGGATRASGVVWSATPPHAFEAAYCQGANCPGPTGACDGQERRSCGGFLGFSARSDPGYQSRQPDHQLRDSNSTDLGMAQLPPSLSVLVAAQACRSPRCVPAG